MINNETLRKANEGLATIDQKGKKYVMVNDRVKAFRNIEPDGLIETHFPSINFDLGVAVCVATIYDANGQKLATGTAYEREGQGFVNKTSFIENCETSAVGRALGFLGIGIDDSMASADEVANAMQQQNELTTDKEKKTFMDLCAKKGLEPEDILRQIGWKSGMLTKAQHGLAIKKIMELENGN